MIAYLFGEFWPWLAGALSAVVALVIAWMKGRRDAWKNIENDAMKGVLDDLEIARNARRSANDIERLRDDDGYRRP